MGENILKLQTCFVFSVYFITLFLTHPSLS